MLIEPNAKRMHQDHTQHAIAQVLQISCPNVLDPTAIRRLPENGVNPIANLSQNRTLVSGRLRRVRFAKRRLQDDSFCVQTGLHVGQPIVAIAQDQALCSFPRPWQSPPCRLRRRAEEEKAVFAEEPRTPARGRALCNPALSMVFPTLQQPWCSFQEHESQKHMGNDARPPQTQIQTKTVKGLAISVIFAIVGLSAKAYASGSARKATERIRHVNDADQLIMSDQRVTQRHPQTFFECPQIGRLPNKGRVMHLRQFGKKVGEALLKKGKECFVLADPQIRTHHFHHRNLAIRKLGHGASLSKPLILCQHWHPIVNPTKTGDNKVVQVHESPP